jgi:hypothetical protein
VRATPLGTHYGLTGPFTTSAVQATGAGGVKSAVPSALPKAGSAFASYLQP